jgi:hypothetical protein
LASKDPVICIPPSAFDVKRYKSLEGRLESANSSDGNALKKSNTPENRVWPFGCLYISVQRTTPKVQDVSQVAHDEYEHEKEESEDVTFVARGRLRNYLLPNIIGMDGKNISLRLAV